MGLGRQSCRCWRTGWLRGSRQSCATPAQRVSTTAAAPIFCRRSGGFPPAFRMSPRAPGVPRPPSFHIPSLRRPQLPPPCAHLCISALTLYGLINVDSARPHVSMLQRIPKSKKCRWNLEYIFKYHMECSPEKCQPVGHTKVSMREVTASASTAGFELCRQ